MQTIEVAKARIVELEAEVAQRDALAEELNSKLLEERLSNIGKVHPCDDQTAGNLASALADNEELRVALSHAEDALAKRRRIRRPRRNTRRPRRGSSV